MIQLLGRASSINVRKVLWLGVELDLPFAHEAWDSGSRSTASAQFLALNPNGLVPVIRDGNFVLWESNTICRYLAARAQRLDLLPTEPQARARVEQWMDWQATELNNAWRYAFMARVRRSPAHTDALAIEASIEAWNRHMALFDAHLARTGGFATGAAFTLADIVLGLATHRWFMTPMPRPDLPAVAAYYELLTSRPGFRLHGRNQMP